MRPELVTLLIVPATVWLFLRRAQRSSALWLAGLAGLMIIGANAHGGALVVPILLAGIFIAEVVEMALAKNWHRGTVISGLVGIATAVGALLINPYGWHLFTVPVRLSHLVNLDHIPNPEWISPSLTQAPILYAALAATVVVLALRERRLAYWALLLMVSVLALRHIRNVGLFFVLLPLIAAPSLATWRVLTISKEESRHDQRRTNLQSSTTMCVLGAISSTATGPNGGSSRTIATRSTSRFCGRSGKSFNRATSVPGPTCLPVTMPTPPWSATTRRSASPTRPATSSVSVVSPPSGFRPVIGRWFIGMMWRWSSCGGTRL
ncbi:MAG: hypothetical protein IFK92_16255 [Acidobacteria bacterium]|nr:hypothetical protein [Candidatus Sulfomarinibacter kjeldsenii]